MSFQVEDSIIRTAMSACWAGGACTNTGMAPTCEAGVGGARDEGHRGAAGHQLHVRDARGHHARHELVRIDRQRGRIHGLDEGCRRVLQGSRHTHSQDH